MKKHAYYNEKDPFAAAWLRELIKDGLIADGVVDERSITDVTPNDVANFRQCHFFAGIGGWSYALRLAGWPDDKPVWTGSAPCQPFSDAGRGAGFDDERHLWPAFFWLIRQCRPDTIFGEQVSSKAGLKWWDVVSSDLEAEGYGVGAFDLCAPSVGAFHIRQRLYFVGMELAKGNRGHGTLQSSQREEISRVVDEGADGQLANPSIARIGEVPAGQRRPGETTADVIGRSGLDGLAHTANQGLSQRGQPRQPTVAAERGTGLELQPERFSSPGVALGDASSTGLEKRPGQPGNAGEEQSAVERAGGGELADAPGSQQWGLRQRRSGDGRKQLPDRGHGATGGFWSSAEWILCRDGKARPVEPGIFPLAHGVSNRVGTLRGAGNAIVPQLAAEFIIAYREYKEQS